MRAGENITWVHRDDAAHNGDDDDHMEVGIEEQEESNDVASEYINLAKLRRIGYENVPSE